MFFFLGSGRELARLCAAVRLIRPCKRAFAAAAARARRGRGRRGVVSLGSFRGGWVNLSYFVHLC